MTTYLTTRHLKVWHDHGKIAGHGHLLVMVSAIYDPACFLASQEMEGDINVFSMVEQPQIHLLARSGSSDLEQAVFSTHRTSSLQTMQEDITTFNSTPMHDVVRFFHGDKPAQQFECGNKVGGHYPCVMCHAHANRFDDLAYCFRCDTISLADRQTFMLSGAMWEEKKSKPLDHLSLSQLQRELQSRGIDTSGKLRSELDATLQDIRKGIATFPALLLDSPDSPLASVGLQAYEVPAIEPLHDFKGHMSNIFHELPRLLTGETYVEVTKVKESVLNKDTLRCVDYRKAAILLSRALHSTQASEDIRNLADTAVEICVILYATDDLRTPRNILRLHNLTFIHGRLCVKLFQNPKSLTKRKMFGNYFHSLVCHSAPTYRVICLRSLNTEFQERTFGQANGITKQTSNKNPQHIIDNAILRIQAEATRTLHTISQQDSEVSRLASTWSSPPNTTFTTKDVDQYSSEFQTHLERISDYLLPGPGVWWKQTQSGIEFLDCPKEGDTREQGPKLQHFRSSMVKDIQIHLFNCWEQCLQAKVPLPLVTVRQYTSDGELQTISHTESEREDDEAELYSDEEEHREEEVIIVEPAPATKSTSVPEQCTLNALPCMTSTTPSLPKSKLGRVLLDVVPDIHLVLQFDEARSKTKQDIHNGRANVLNTSRTKLLSQKVKEQVLKSHKRAIREVQDFITSRKNDIPPKEYPDHIKTATHKASICKKILAAEWKTTI